MKKFTDKELADFQRQRSERRNPGYSRLKRQREAEMLCESVRCAKRRRPSTTTKAR